VLAIVFVALLLAVIETFAGLYNIPIIFANQFPSASSPAMPSQPLPATPRDEYHIHVDFALYINNERFNFSHPRFDVQNALPKGRYAHMHLANPDGDKVIHIHAEGVPLAWFFEGVRMNITSECLAFEEGWRYCNDAGSNTGSSTGDNSSVGNGNNSKTLKVFAQNFGSSWKQIENFDEYMPLDLDRILVTYGNEDAAMLQDQMQSVSNFSANYSGPPSVG